MAEAFLWGMAVGIPCAAASLALGIFIGRRVYAGESLLTVLGHGQGVSFPAAYSAVRADEERLARAYLAGLGGHERTEYVARAAILHTLAHLDGETPAANLREELARLQAMLDDQIRAVARQGQLLQVVRTRRAGGRLADLLDRGQQQADEDRDDGDDHAAILAAPADDTRRLAYADRLDENAVHCPACGGSGDVGHAYDRGVRSVCGRCKGYKTDGRAGRAEFIRVQCELARWTCDFKQTPEQPGWRHDCGTDANGYWQCQPLRSRERELFAAWAGVWWPGKPVALTPPNDRERRAGVTMLVVSRGDISHWYGPTAAWRGAVCERCDGQGCTLCGGDDRDYHTSCNECPGCDGIGRVGAVGPAVVRKYPLDADGVRFVDRVPAKSSQHLGLFRWYTSDVGDDDHGVVPVELYQLLPPGDATPLGSLQPYWATAEAANLALGRAAVAWARDVAGSPAGAEG